MSCGAFRKKARSSVNDCASVGASVEAGGCKCLSTQLGNSGVVQIDTLAEDTESAGEDD